MGGGRGRKGAKASYTLTHQYIAGSSCSYWISSKGRRRLRSTVGQTAKPPPMSHLNCKPTVKRFTNSHRSIQWSIALFTARTPRHATKAVWAPASVGGPTDCRYIADRSKARKTSRNWRAADRTASLWHRCRSSKTATVHPSRSSDYWVLRSPSNGGAQSSDGRPTGTHNAVLSSSLNCRLSRCMAGYFRHVAASTDWCMHSYNCTATDVDGNIVDDSIRRWLAFSR